MALPRYEVKTPMPLSTDNAAEAVVLEDAYNAKVNAELIAFAREVGHPEGWHHPRFEVAYPNDLLEHPDGGTLWDRSGDAIEVNLDVEPPVIRTLTHEEWAAS